MYFISQASFITILKHAMQNSLSLFVRTVERRLSERQSSEHVGQPNGLLRGHSWDLRRTSTQK